MNNIKNKIDKIIIKTINENSLNRAFAHINKTASKSFGLITAYRSENSHSENKRRNKLLANDIRSFGYGFFKLEGHYKECPINNPNCEDKERIPVTEITFFIPNISLEQMKKLTKKYGQEASLYSGEDIDNKIASVSNAGTVTVFSSKATPDKFGEIYSKLKNHTFIFEYKNYFNG